MASPSSQPAWYGSAPLVPPAPPRAVNRAVRLMWAGAALAVLYGVVDGLTRHLRVGGILPGVVAGLLWLWMAWKNNAGRNWARVLSSVFFGTTIPGLLGSVADRRWAPALLVFLIECGVGLAAVILLWRPQSSQFFAAARQARLTAAAVPPYPGTADPADIQGPGYGRSAEAIPLYERTLADREQVLGGAHPDTLTSRNNLAGAYRSGRAAGRGHPAVRAHPRRPRAGPGRHPPRHPDLPQQPRLRLLSGRAAGRGHPAVRAHPHRPRAGPGRHPSQHPDLPQQPRPSLPGGRAAGRG